MIAFRDVFHAHLSTGTAIDDDFEATVYYVNGQEQPLQGPPSQGPLQPPVVNVHQGPLSSPQMRFQPPGPGMHFPQQPVPFYGFPPSPSPPRPGIPFKVAALAVGVVTAVVAIVVTVILVVKANSFSSQDQHYLAAVHHPCSHREIFDLSDGCSFGQEFWKWPDDKTLVNDAHAVCAAESDARVGEKTQAGEALIAARHPNYYDLQASVQQIAARKIYCPDVLSRP